MFDMPFTLLLLAAWMGVFIGGILLAMAVFIPSERYLGWPGIWFALAGWVLGTVWGYLARNWAELGVCAASPVVTVITVWVCQRRSASG
jgi:hypothetical protein